jgi:hypothetical protein
MARTDPPTWGLKPGDAWDILERFGQDLQSCAEPAAQARLLVQAVCDSTRAEAAFFDPGPGREPVAVLGPGRLTPAWCRDLTRRVLQACPGAGGEVLCGHWHESSAARPADPCGVALVCLSRSRSAWLAALGFDPGRPFDAGHLKPLRLARRLFLNHHKQSRAQDRLKDTLFGLIHCLTEALDAKDPYTWGHSERVGRIGARDSVLRKPGRLTPEEAAHVQEHTLIGDRIVANIKPLEHLRPGVRNHHEHYDGGGYPDGLAGPAIPLLARILAVADACDAMMADRPYRRALPPARIDAVLAEGAGRQWDPEVIAPFQACRAELYPICQRGLGESVARAVGRTVDRGEEASERGR